MNLDKNKLIECIINRENRMNVKWKFGMSENQLQDFIATHSKEIAYKLLKDNT